MQTLIIGNGEIGKALRKVLAPHFVVFVKDKENLNTGAITVLHICYPYSKHFIRDTKNYIKQYNPLFTVIHSTVPVGTSKKCKAYHSPVRGIHPHLEEGLKTFLKYLAPKNDRLARYFRKAGVQVRQTEKTETTELAKILSTTRYGLDIIFNKEAYRLCRQFKADFSIVYKDWSKSYNDGFERLGNKKYTRPVLEYVKGKIGGHCVVPNCDLLDSLFTNLIKEKNG